VTDWRFSSGKTSTYARREASSTATWTNAQPAPSEPWRRSPVAPVTDAAEAGELLRIEVDELAGACAAVTPRRLARLECGQATEPQPPEMAGDGAPRQAKPQGDLLAGHAVLATQPGNHGEPGRWQLVGDEVWSAPLGPDRLRFRN
jgi:hypothetical protein